MWSYGERNVGLMSPIHQQARDNMKLTPYFRQGRLPTVQLTRDQAAFRIKSWRACGAKVSRTGTIPRIIKVSDWRNDYLNKVYMDVEVIFLRQQTSEE